MIEEWKDIQDYEGYYQVSNLGKLRSLDRIIDFPNRHKGVMVKRLRKGSVMKPGNSPNGYKVCRLTKDGVFKHYSFHRLVAKAFIENPLNLPQINHIDGNKKNNEVSNLEWCSQSHNILHAYNVLKVGNFMGINQYTKNL